MNFDKAGLYLNFFTSASFCNILPFRLFSLPVYLPLSICFRLDRLFLLRKWLEVVWCSIGCISSFRRMMHNCVVMPMHSNCVLFFFFMKGKQKVMHCLISVFAYWPSLFLTKSHFAAHCMHVIAFCALKCTTQLCIRRTNAFMGIFLASIAWMVLWHRLCFLQILAFEGHRKCCKRGKKAGIISAAFWDVGEPKSLYFFIKRKQIKKFSLYIFGVKEDDWVDFYILPHGFDLHWRGVAVGLRYCSIIF